MTALSQLGSNQRGDVVENRAGLDGGSSVDLKCCLADAYHEQHQSWRAAKFQPCGLALSAMLACLRSRLESHDLM